MLALLAMMAFTGCEKSVEQSPAATTAPAIGLKDGANRSVALATVPQRIVSISPAATDMLLAEDAHAQIVGATRFCVIPPADESHVRRIGGMVDPDYEGILSLKPDLVVIPWLVDKTLQDKLVSLGLSVVVLHPESLAGVLADLRMLGAATGHAAAGAALAKHIEDICALTERRWHGVPAEKRPRVLITMDGISPAPGSYVDDVLIAAGGRNALPRGNKAWVQVSPESGLQVAPDIVVAIPSSPLPPEGTANTSLLRTVTLANGDAFYHPGPDLGDAVWMLARVLDPPRFPEAQPPATGP